MASPKALQTSTHRVSVGEAGVVAVPGHAFQAVSLAWAAADRGWSPEFRASPDGRSWSRWIAAREDPHGKPGGLRRFAAPQFLDDSMRYLALRGSEGASPREVEVTFVNPSSPSVSLTPPIFRAASAGVSVPMPPVVSRTDWGCPDGQGSRWSPVSTEVEFLIVHHTAGSNSSANWAASVQAVWSFHALTRGWGDIGYNFLIDPNGVIYEGRAGGDSSIGAHFSCANGNTMGIGMLGNFTDVEPTAAARASLVQLLAWKACKEEIDPLGRGFHTGTALDLNRISGHRDGNASDSGGACPSGTVCPGAMLYPQLSGIREDVAALLAAPRIDIEAAVATPDEVGAGEQTTIAYQLVSDRAMDAHFVVKLRGPSGSRPAAAFSTFLTEGRQTKNRGLSVPNDMEPGSYDLEVAVSLSAGSALLAEVAIPEVLRISSPPVDYNTWISGFFPGEPLSLTARNADPDNDNLVNLLEYALLLDPTAVSIPDLRFTWVESDGKRFPSLTYTVRDVPHLEIGVEIGAPSGSWDADLAIVSDLIANADGTLTRTSRSPWPDADLPYQQLRLRITETAP